MFHYALKPNGFLIFGGSGTAALRELFFPVDPGRGIYARREPARKLHALRPDSRGGRPPEQARGPHAAGGNDAGLPREVDRILLSRYSPAGVVVDKDLEVLEIRGSAGSFSRCPPAK